MAESRHRLVGMLFALFVMVQAYAQDQNYLDETAKIEAQISYAQKQTELRSLLTQLSPKEGLPEGLPHVVSIVKDRKGTSAQVAYTNGMVRWVAVGDAIQDGVKVVAVGRSVVVEYKKKRADLPFVAPATTGVMPGVMPTAGGVIPPLPALPDFRITQPSTAPASPAK